MEATTKLQFTLTSPGNNPPSPGGSDTPSGSNTPSNPTYYTSTGVGAPNTGENSASNDNIGGTVFTSLFILIGIAALLVFLAKYLKKNRHLSFAERGSFHISSRPRVYATVALTLAVAFLGGITITNIYGNAERNTNAASQRSLKVTAQPNITFDVTRGQVSIKSDTIKVENGGAKYDLIAYTSDNRFLRTGSTDNYLIPVTADVTANTNSLSAIGTDEWGMSIQNGTMDISGRLWGAAPTKETIIDSNATSGSKTVSYGVNLGTNLPDGTYTTSVTYKAFAKNYKVTTIRGFVNKTGESTNDWFDDGKTVYIRPNCGTAKFINWTSDDIDVSIISGPTEGNIYQFTMPAKDVTITAHCDKWQIAYDANAPSGTTATGTMNPTIAEGDSADLTTNAFAITDYTFQGWACNKAATAADFTDSQKGITQSALESKGCAKTPGNPEANPATYDSYTLYALWKKGGSPDPGPDPGPVIGDIWIQDVTPEMCGTGSKDKGIKLFEIVHLPDKRKDGSGASKITGYTYAATYTESDGTVRKTPDNEEHIWYPFTKFADGRCWMLQDLVYQPGAATVALTQEDTDISSNRSVEFATSGTTKAAYHTNGTTAVLYNYRAASGGYYTGSNLTVGKNIPDSLCPKSWKIPDAWNIAENQPGDTSGELSNLATYNIGKTNGGGSTMTNQWKLDTFLLGGTTISANNGTFPAPHFTYSGAWDFSTGNWWTKQGADSGAAGSYASYFLNTVKESNMVMAFNPHKTGNDHSLPSGQSTDPAHGSSVRCLLRTAEQLTTRDAGAPAGDITKDD